MTTTPPATVSLEDRAFTEEAWEQTGKELLAKMLAEFTYEALIDPEKTDTGYRLPLGEVTYEFAGQDRLCDSLLVDTDSIVRIENGDTAPATDPVRFLRDAQETIGVDDLTAGHLIREYKRTQLADAHIYARDTGLGAASVTDLSYAEIEGEMAGHPWITYNKGRVGWGYDEYRKFAPELGANTQFYWVALSRDHATFSGVTGLDHDGFVQTELGDQYDEFCDILRDKNLDPADYLFIPVHEYQWNSSITQLYPGAIARDEIVLLGTGEDRYRPMQSVRTFVNVDDEQKHNVKVPMRILNTLVWRGLPGERTEVAPLVTEYVTRIRDDDPFLRDECGLLLPGEVASVNFDHPDFTAIEGAPYQYDELLGVVWRESIDDLVRDGEQPITLAALLHVSDGEPFVSQLIDESGLSVEAWLDELFSAMLPPLLHYLYRYGTVFSPHGQNTILVVEDGVPTRIAVKDFVDDVNVSDQPFPELESLPEEVKAILRSEPPEGLTQFIFTGLFVCVLRYLSNVLTEQHDYPEQRFWMQVRETVLDYQAQFPELQNRFELFDLLRPTLTKLCLNRNRILQDGYADDGGRPHAAEHGEVVNPLWEVVQER
ncbi:IucA/IucC family protein [Haladaptatus sp. CMSO5]|uniref:IucA/IucC family protein n=1 Tax=Haladaptatus sp. CMSO5 TaxID=3120514 RepID=UPI002FCE4D82